MKLLHFIRQFTICCIALLYFTASNSYLANFVVFQVQKSEIIDLLCEKRDFKQNDCQGSCAFKTTLKKQVYPDKTVDFVYPTPLVLPQHTLHLSSLEIPLLTSTQAILLSKVLAKDLWSYPPELPPPISFS